MLHARNAAGNTQSMGVKSNVLLAFSGCQYKGEQPLKANRTRPKTKQSNPSPALAPSSKSYQFRRL